MNVQLVNPALVVHLFASGDAAKAGSRWPAPVWAKVALARLGQTLRYRRTLHELRRLDGRQLDDLGLASADLPALAWRHAHRSERPALRGCERMPETLRSRQKTPMISTAIFRGRD
jgi:uncharacterized protein YjiS (DUF1127 family)